MVASEALISEITIRDQASAAADRITAAMQRLAGAEGTVQDATARSGRAIETTGRSLERLKAAVDPIYAANLRLAQTQVQLTRAVELGLSNQAEATTIMQRHIAVATQAGGVTRNLGSAVQQAGFQVGDFAVQIASGQGVLRPFIQQGTQLISMFGPWGAVIGAAGAVVGALATTFFDLTTATEAAVERQKEFNKELTAANDLMDKLNDKGVASREQLLSQRQTMVNMAQAALMSAQNKLDQTKEFTGAGRTSGRNDEWSRQNALVKELTRNLADLQAQLGFFGGGHGDRMGLSHDLDSILASRTDLFGGSGGVGAGLDKGAKEAQQNLDAVAGALAGLQRQYDNMSRASVDVRADDLFFGKVPTEADLARARELFRLIDEHKASDAAKGLFQDSLQQGFTQHASEALQQQKSLQTQQDQVAVLQKQLELSAANDNVSQLAVAHLQAQQQAQVQFGTTLDANAQKYIANADAIALMNQELTKQRAVAQELPQFFDQAFDRIGSAITQAMATGQVAFTNLLDVGRAVVSELIQEFIKLALLNPLKNWMNGDSALPTFNNVLGGLFGGGGGAGLGSVNAVSGMLGHAARGGYIEVGENGPERFYPGTSGTVVPNGGGGMVTNVNVTVNASGGTPAQNRDLADQTQKAVQRAVEDAVDKRLAQHMRTGNMLNRGMAA